MIDIDDIFPDHHHRRPVICPWCKYTFDTSSQLSGNKNKPQGGDASICFNCAKVSLWLGTGELRRPSYEEVENLFKEHPELILVVEAVKLTQKQMARAAKEARRANRRR